MIPATRAPATSARALVELEGPPGVPAPRRGSRHGAVPPARRAEPPRGRSRPRVVLRAALALTVLLDATALVTGAVASQLVRDPLWQVADAGPAGLAGLAVALPLWCGLIAAGHGYEPTGVRLGPDVVRVVPGALLDAAARWAAGAALLLLLARPAAARGLVVVVPVALGTAVLLRAVAAPALRGWALPPVRVLLVGRPGPVEGVRRRLALARRGVRVVGRCLLPDEAAAGESSDGDPFDGELLGGDPFGGDPFGGDPFDGDLFGKGTSAAGEAADALTVGDLLRRQVTAAARTARADAVVLADSAAFPAGNLRRLSWSLHAGGIGLLLAVGPDAVGGGAVTGVAGGRLRVRPLGGVPVLPVAPPVFTGPRRALKEVVDRAGALLLLVLLAPVLAGVATAVRVAGPGPVLFRQERVGRHGRRFVMLKFRSMTADATARRAGLDALNDHFGGVLFKMRADPRVTDVGRVLRRLSLDELPQLVNVLRGEMSLVGPRPALPAEVLRYRAEVLRRLLVKPGMTGLWQVSGRADLDWAESVRLDVGYVDNWSLGLDLEILRRTARAVVRGAGAR